MSLNEFSLYIQGAKLQRQHKLNQLDAETKRELESNMQELFDIMDTDKSRSISADEIMLTMKSIGHSIDKAKA